MKIQILLAAIGCVLSFLSSAMGLIYNIVGFEKIPMSVQHLVINLMQGMHLVGSLSLVIFFISLLNRHKLKDLLGGVDSPF